VNRYIISSKTANFDVKTSNLVIFFSDLVNFFGESSDFCREACGTVAALPFSNATVVRGEE